MVVLAGGTSLSGPDIFLSYNREDAARAKQFADALAAEGFGVWWDATLRSGENYDEVTEAALIEARAVVVLWSAKSVVSRWVRAEATEAERAGKLVPAMIEDCKRPIMFELKQSAELSHWKGNRKDFAWLAFVEDLHRHVGKSGDQAEDAPVPNPAATPPKSDWRRLWPSVAILLVVLLGAVIAWTQFGRDTSGAPGSVEIMVLSFTPAGNDPREAAIANGITDELIVRLRHIPELRVVSGVGSGLASVSADHRIDGSVRLNGDEIRLSPRLLDSSGNVLWSDNFERQVDDLFQVQERIASAVASTLSVSLDVGIESRDYGGTSNPEAYANYFKGRVARWTGDPGRFSYLERAVALDPNYIKAWAELAYANGLALYADNSWEEADQYLKRMDQASTKALELNPNLWVGQQARAWYAIATDDFTSADEQIRLADKQDKGIDPDMRLTQALAAFQFGRYHKSAELRQSLATIDPIYGDDPERISDLLSLRQFDAAIAEYDRLMKIKPGGAAGYSPFVFWALLLKGETAKAKEFAIQKKLPPPMQSAPNFRYDPETFPNLPLAELRKWAERKFKSSGRNQLLSSSFFASQMGDQELALSYLRVAFEHKGIGWNQYIWHPALAPLRKTPEFAKWIEERGLAAAWRKSGEWSDYCKPVSETEITCT
ncbi:TIR domain-containing protein [Altererythrobacter salegens]|uniref:TIR domain-containing protein n=1 Tax=Croceibacterium salegens TaxID=1737568 RepID=A0A6I4SYW2_9SPHN|nr:TIR domain-containing protein [Croceibacterium salegens]MXO60380.1 TIR domain-containing protein [Croceibacterium salegens]